MYTVVIDRGDNCKGVQYQFITEGCESLKDANMLARRIWNREAHGRDVCVFDESGHLAAGGFDSRQMRNFYIVITNKETGEDKIVGRRKDMLSEVNDQAAWMWRLLSKHEKRKRRIMVQGELRGEQGFDSERLQ